MVCRNHPDRNARRKCFQCKVPICPPCQHKAHHHIFCGESCVEEFLKLEDRRQTASKGKTKANRLKNELERMDSSLHDDLRDFSEDAFDRTHKEFERLENELDRALTALATMVEGSSSATGTEIKSFQKEVEQRFRLIERRTEENGAVSEDSRAQIKGLIAGLRNSVLDFQKNLDSIHEKQGQKTDHLLERIGEVEEKLENQGNALAIHVDERVSNAEKNTRAQLDGIQAGLTTELESLLSSLRKGFEDQGEKAETVAETVRKRLDEKVDQLSKDSSQSVRAASDDLSEKIRSSEKQLSFLISENLGQLSTELSDQLEQLKKIQNEFQVFTSETYRQTSEELLENQEKGLVDFQTLVGRSSAQILSRIDEQVRDLEKQRKQLEAFQSNELPQLFSSLSEESKEVSAKVFRQLVNQEETNTANLKEFSKRVEEAFAGFRQEINREFSDRLQKIVDDFAALTVAQKGNWNEVIRGAQEGARKAAMELRNELRKQLYEEVREISSFQSSAIGKFIDDIRNDMRRRIRSAVSPWPMRLAYGFLFIFALLLMGVPFFTMQWAERQVAQVQERMDEQDHTLREWISDQLAGLTPEKRTKEVVKRKTATVKNLTRGNLLRKEVAFTFDGGSNSKAAEEILNILKDKRVQSTMFLTGVFIDRNPELVKEMVANGHEVANHLMKHDAVVDYKTKRTLLTRAEFEEQIKGVEERFEKATGMELTPFWRAPYGEVNDEVLRWAAEMGYTHVGWSRRGRTSLDTLDWVADPDEHLYRTADEIVSHILKFEKTDPHGLNGAVILMHLGTERKEDYPHRKLKELMSKLSEKGYRPVKVSEVARTILARR